MVPNSTQRSKKFELKLLLVAGEKSCWRSCGYGSLERHAENAPCEESFDDSLLVTYWRKLLDIPRVRQWLLEDCL